MAVDKLVDSTQLDADLTSVANAIRTKGGTSASLAFPADFVSAIAAIPTGGGSSVQSGTYTPSENTVGPSFDVGIDASHFIIYALTSPLGNSIKVFVGAVLDFTQNHTNMLLVSSNNSGASFSAGGAYGNVLTWFSKSGTTITCTNTGTSGANNAGYWCAGVTYQWYAW